MIIFIAIYILIITYSSIINPNIVYNDIINSLNIWLYKVFPPIFIFYIISSFILSTNLIDYFNYILKPFKKIFKFETENGFNLFIISFFVGNPTTASYITKYYEENKITLNDASSLLKCASFITPLFIFSIFPDQLTLSCLIYLSHILSNIGIAIFITRKNKVNNNSQETIKNKINFLSTLTNFPSIILTIALMMSFCATITTCLNFLSIPIEISAFLEMSNGVYSLLNTFNTSFYSLILITALISFNGLCIHMQIASILNNKIINNIKSKNNNFLKYFCFRIIQSILSVVIFTILYYSSNLLHCY